MIGLDMADAAFLEAVEDASLPTPAFDHRAHLRLASIPDFRLPPKRSETHSGSRWPGVRP